MRALEAGALSAERGFDGRERGVSLRSVGTTGLRHVRPPAAAFAAERLGALAHQIDGVEAWNEIVGDSDDDAGFAILGNTDNSDNPGADLLLAFIG